MLKGTNVPQRGRRRSCHRFHHAIRRGSAHQHRPSTYSHSHIRSASGAAAAPYLKEGVGDLVLAGEELLLGQGLLVVRCKIPDCVLQEPMCIHGVGYEPAEGKAGATFSGCTEVAVRAQGTSSLDQGEAEWVLLRWLLGQSHSQCASALAPTGNRYTGRCSSDNIPAELEMDPHALACADQMGSAPLQHCLPKLLLVVLLLALACVMPNKRMPF